MRIYEECKACLYNSQLKKVERGGTDGEKFREFKEEVKRLCENPPESYCAPLLMRDIDGVHRKIFGSGIDYSREKSLFNKKLLGNERGLYDKIISSPRPLEAALRFSMSANYIDFARLAELDETAVNYVIEAAERAKPSEGAVKSLENRLNTAKKLCFLHDNCGEIVLDKILIRVIKRLFPQIGVISVVRGSEIINDVTEKDAFETGLDEFAEILNNGTNVPGTYLSEVNRETLDALKNSDVIISKGLGNLETLYGEGYGAFYSFTCKCAHIARRFGAELWSAVFVEEERY